MSKHNDPQLVSRERTPPWGWAYGLMGTVNAGVIPILVPLWTERTAGAREVGLVMAAFNLGALTSILWGFAADRLRWHRGLFFGGFALTGLGIVLFPVAHHLHFQVLLALTQGAGAAAVATVASLFVVEFSPRSEWNDRIGRLQTGYGAGQVAGLILAGVLSGRPGLGLVLSALVLLPVFYLGRLALPGPPIEPARRPRLAWMSRRVEFGVASLFSHYRHPSLLTFKALVRKRKEPSARFLLGWFFSLAGSVAFTAFYPLIMLAAYGIRAGPSALYFALAAAAGLSLYASAGRLNDRLGTVRMVRLSLGARLSAYAALAVLAFTDLPLQAWLAPTLFGIIVLFWSTLSVGSTALMAQLSPEAEGQAMGMLNTTTALASVFGAVAGGFMADRFGYPSVSLAPVVLISLGLVLLAGLKDPSRPLESTTPSQG